jgi:hypothetical protein
VCERLMTMTEAHSRNASYSGDRGDWLIVMARNRDSDALARSNFDAALARLEGPTVAVERSSHWAVGWVDYLIVDPSDTERVMKAMDMLRGLEEVYPVLDDDLFSQYEFEERQPELDFDEEEKEGVS